MEIRFKKTSSIFDVGVTAVAAILSVGVMLYGVLHFGLSRTWPELVLNLLYIACLVMMGMYFFYSRKAWKTYSKGNLPTISYGLVACFVKETNA